MKKAGFTLIELMAAMAVSLLLMALLFSVLDMVSKTTRRSTETSSAFDEARIAFGDLQTLLAQATLSPYWNVSYGADGNPKGYFRESDLHFIVETADSLVPSGRKTRGGAVFFQAPTGFDPTTLVKDSALNAAGFFVEYRDANSDMPLAGTGLVPSRWRFQLRKFNQPSSELGVFNTSDATSREWFQAPLSATNAPLTTLAENILLLIVRARTVDGGVETLYYFYDSRSWDGSGTQPPTSNQLPALLDVMMVACDEATAERMAGNGTMPALPPELFADPAKLDDDTVTFENKLATDYPGGVFRTFRATVPIRAAKWSIDASP
jgi:uncharacterized protein (TIGR02599 family)